MLATEDGAAPTAPTPASDEPERAPPVAPAAARRPSRFLWTVDADGRFGAPDPALVATLGAAAPQGGERVEAACLRAAVADGAALVAAIGKRETFAGVTVLWDGGDGAHAVPLTFSAAPLFDSARGFAAFKGFGAIGAPVEAARPTATATEDAQPDSAQAEPLDAPARPLDEETAAAFAVDRPADDAEAPPSQPPEPAAPPEAAVPLERTAEIYVLRHGSAAPPAPSKIVPIRPGAFDASRPHDPGDDGDGGVELSKAEREAFREIARALVGRAPVSRHDAPPLPAAPSREAAPLPIESAGPAVPAPDAAAERPRPADFDTAPVLRNTLALLDRLPLGVLVARDAQPLYVNLTLLGLLGYPDVERFEAAAGLSAMFQGGVRPALPDADDGLFSIFTANGEALAVEGRAQAIVWDGAPATLIMLRPAAGAGRAAARAGGEPEAVANDLAEMLALATDGAVVLDSAGRIQSFNASAQKLFGFSEHEVAGESVLMLLAPQSHPAATARLESLSRLDEDASGEPRLAVVGRDRDGASLALGLTLARVGPSEAPYYCALFRNMRPERDAERRLAAARDAALAASAAKTDFLAHVSHEIRTPLHAILGFAEVMMEERFGPIGNDRYRDYLKDIHASGRHIMSLADDLLDLSKIESGKLELAFAPVDANSLIRECVSLMQPQASRERIIMRLSLFDRLPRVIVDERSLRQIMLNLMSNAVKYNEPGGQVIVSTALDAAGQAVIRVRDTGVGMNESEVGVALEPFGQVGRGARKGGVGLGLPLTKALVEANKAEFSIKSRRDHGTLVEICFPLVQAAQ